ncbi:DHA2 family efflux MFS transporter permease subunit [Bacillus cereus]|uniref:DHA2 family efflux MFS transporter permease subunit n=1 Tax=Bacillus cereus TaxID=1396 RepID=UPI001C3F1CEE|nr:DHA2 family efflux MFS transporter permease subunit [Bacillus cereus]
MKKFLGLLAILLGFFIALLDTTIVNITLPKITEHFNTDIKTISWVLNGYNLAFAVILITASRLADQFGRKKIYLIGVTFFTITSFLCGISTSVEMMITFRILQGFSAALVVPVTMPMSMELISKEKRGALMGFWGAFGGLAAASGPAVGGILTDKFNWQWIFYINIPIGILAIILTIFLIRESYDPTSSKKVDWLGIITLSVSLFAVVLALIQAADTGWTSLYILSLFAISLFFLSLFVFIEQKSQEPMVPLELFRNLPFSAGSLSFLMVGLGLMSGAFLLSFFLTKAMGLSELESGLIITAMPLTAIPFSAISGPLSQKFGSRWFIVTGMICLTAMIYLCGDLTLYSSKWDIVWRLILGGAGIGLTMAPLMSTTVNAVPEDKIGIASGVTNMARTFGTVLGVALLVTILNGNINNIIPDAQSKAISIVQSSSSLDNHGKKELIDELKAADFSESNSIPSKEETLKKIENKKEDVLKVAPPQAQESIKMSFEQGKKAIETLYPEIEENFKSHVSKAFSNTFKTASFIMLLGVLFAYYSDSTQKQASSKRRKTTSA